MMNDNEPANGSLTGYAQPARPVGSWANALNNIKVGTKRNRRPAPEPAKLGREEMSLDSRGTTFKLFPAAGGLVVETYYYDNNKDENRTSLHLIPEDDDLAEALAKIITMEAMRR